MKCNYIKITFNIFTSILNTYRHFKSTHINICYVVKNAKLSKIIHDYEERDEQWQLTISNYLLFIIIRRSDRQRA